MSTATVVKFPEAHPRPDPRRQREDATIRRALCILSNRMRQPGELLASPTTARNYVRLRAGALEHEVFMVLYMDVQSRVIACDELFRGTLAQTSIHPREVVKATLRHNAASVLLAHNHPSGKTAPSEADQILTRALVQALALVEVRVLDHIIVTANDSYSFAEHGDL